MTTAPEMKIRAIVPWFGANRLLAESVGRELGPCKWVGVPFMGSCSELPHIQTRAGVANDLHRHVVNLSRVIRDWVLGEHLVQRLSETLFHPEELADAQRRCMDREVQTGGNLFGGQAPSTEPDLDWAYDYFICAWMGPGAKAGKNTELSAYFSRRWSATGGSSAKRFRSAIESLTAWQATLSRWEFDNLDAFEFLGKCKDDTGHGIYCDPPWPDAGVEYKHSFTVEQQGKLARQLAKYKHARVVVRYGDHPLIRELFPESCWCWVRQFSRDQTNGEVSEVLIVNGPSLAGMSAVECAEPTP